MAYTINVCTCCMFAAVYGDPCSHCYDSEECQCEPCEEHPAGLMGKLETGEYAVPGDLDNEGFSWWPCEGCGSPKGGDRYKFFIFKA